MRRASKALLKQVEETRRKYAIEVEGLKAEVALLVKERKRHERDAELAAVTASAATKAAAGATDELERVNRQLQEARTELGQLNRCVGRHLFRSWEHHFLLCVWALLVGNKAHHMRHTTCLRHEAAASSMN